VHQDAINEPELLRTSAGGCANFPQSVRWLLDDHVTGQVQDNLPEHTLLIDPLGPHTTLLLSLNPVELEIRRVGPHALRPAAGATGAF
jgi:hypothetical protein